MIGRTDILALVPHQGAMCLWDEVIEWDADRIRLRAYNHRDPTHPLRSNDRLRAIHLCEYGAQAMAVHGGLRARASGGAVKPGVPGADPASVSAVCPTPRAMPKSMSCGPCAARSTFCGLRSRCVTPCSCTA